MVLGCVKVEDGCGGVGWREAARRRGMRDWSAPDMSVTGRQAPGWPRPCGLAGMGWRDMVRRRGAVDGLEGGEDVGGDGRHHHLALPLGWRHLPQLAHDARHLDEAPAALLGRRKLR